MKTLITDAEVKMLIGRGEKAIYIDKDTLMTPSAKDSAKECGIKIIYGKPSASDMEGKKQTNLSMSQSMERIPASANGVDQALVAKIVGEVLKSMGKSEPPSQLVKEADPSGLRLVRGNTIVLEDFNTGNPEHKVKIKEILNIKESPNMATGFMSLENTCFDWHLTYEEIDYIVEGTLEFIVDGKKYVGHAGDVFYIPADTHVTFSAPDKVKFFFVTYPANWAELSGYEK